MAKITLKLAVVQYACINLLCRTINEKNNIQLKPLLFTVVKRWVPRDASSSLMGEKYRAYMKESNFF